MRLADSSGSNLPWLPCKPDVLLHTPLIQLGEIYLEKNNFERAAEVLSEAIRIEPGSAVAHYALGRARYKLSQYAEAEQDFRRAALLEQRL